MRMSIETKVGMCFLIGLLILGVVTFKVEDLGSLARDRKTMIVRLGHAAGLSVSDPVAVAGVRVGQIEQITLGEDAVEVVIRMDADVSIKEGAVAVVAWGGLLGNRYVDISLGDPSAPELPPGSEIPARDAVELGALFRRADTALSKVEMFLTEGELAPQLKDLLGNLVALVEDIRNQQGSLGKLLGSDELYDKALGIADDLQSTSAGLGRLIDQNESRIGSILEGLEAAVPEAREAMATIQRIGESVDSGGGLVTALLKDKEMAEDLRGALTRLDTSLDRVDKFTKLLTEGEGLLAKLTTDDQLAEDFGEAVKSFRAIAERLESGDSTLARLTRDKDIYEDAKKLLEDARETLRSVKEQVPVGTFASVLLSAF